MHKSSFSLGVEAFFISSFIKNGLIMLAINERIASLLSFEEGNNRLAIRINDLMNKKKLSLICVSALDSVILNK